jgi:hypothetical protein
MDKPSIQFYWGPLETTWVDPWDKYPLPYPPSPHCQHEQLDESSSLSPTAVGYLSQRGDLLGLNT